MTKLNGLALALLIGIMPVAAFAGKDICLKDNVQAIWRLNFAKSLKKPGQFSSVSGYRLEDRVVPVYGTALVRGDGMIKVGLYVNRSQDFHPFTDFTITAIGSTTFFSKPSTETATGYLVDSGLKEPNGFSFDKFVDCKTEAVLTTQQ